MTQPPEGPAPGAPAPPHCYLHPDRETYISCQRCGKPICPDCMREASVGYQCPTCLRVGQAQVRQPRTAAGGLVPGRPGTVSMTLIGINVVVFVIATVTGGGVSALMEWGAMLARSVVAHPRTPDEQLLTGVADGAYWRMLTSAFLHWNWLHILLNMYALYLFGPLLERYLGSARFLAAYLTAAVGSSVFVYWLSPVYGLTAGASGAIFGLFAMALVVMYKQGADLRPLLVLLGLNVAFTLFGSSISWQGHLGGFLTGLLLGAAFAYAPRERRALVQYATFGVLWLGILVATIARTAQLT
ncbi:membrane associated rhomboid family serine protease [Mumia flava]|uniref:Membrane associated rhomboid family serine protease n=1 Tax=Mumia flava TaxID=1348852 RepID=A0A0B2B2F3_9ACTN|nr:rhomboid family intramembrane serine protease [Mumia flava]PJJ57615.1 membrane associated rhomboid family serine protease [Mumia flava]